MKKDCLKPKQKSTANTKTQGVAFIHRYAEKPMFFKAQVAITDQEVLKQSKDICWMI